MTVAADALIAKTEAVTITKTDTFELKRDSSQLSFGVSDTLISDSFQKVFDVVDISQEAQEELLRNKQNADALAEYVRRGRGIEIRVVPPRPGKVEINVSSQSVQDSFQFAQTTKLALQKTQSVELNGSGDIKIEQSVELSLSRTVEFLSSSSQISLSAGLSA